MVMAKRKYTKPVKNMEPSMMTVNFTGFTVAPLATDNQYIDLSQVASIINRRFYRQGLNWAVAGFKFLSAPGSNAAVSILKLQNTWITSGTWEKSMRHWLRQQNEAVEAAGAQSATAAFRDFKILMDNEHATKFAAAGSNLNLANKMPAGYLFGDWDASQIVIPNDGAPGVTNEYVLKMYGPSDATAKGMVEGYIRSRSVPQTPDPATPAATESSWLAEMINVGDSEDSVLVNAQFNNRQLPYAQDEYPGGALNKATAMLHDIEYVGTNTIGGTTRLKGGNFPCGLIKVSATNLSETDTYGFTLIVDLVPGHHRGYLAESMVEM